jgi:hypothetical protein
LLSSIALKYDVATLNDSTNIDSLLAVVTLVPILIAAYFEVPEEVKEAVRRVNPFRLLWAAHSGRATSTTPSAESQSSV